MCITIQFKRQPKERPFSSFPGDSRIDCNTLNFRRTFHSSAQKRESVKLRDPFTSHNNIQTKDWRTSFSKPNLKTSTEITANNRIIQIISTQNAQGTCAFWGVSRFNQREWTCNLCMALATEQLKTYSNVKRQLKLHVLVWYGQQNWKVCEHL